ncbi:MAG: bifunctional riboflavin kinase/FAD synthetase [Chloroflexota bacterium]
MNHVYELSNIHLLRPSVVTIGVFDGVHLGHQHLIQRLVAEAHAADRLAVVLTFFPHPDIVLRGLHGRYYLTTPEQRAEYLLALGVDCVVTHPFNEQTRMMRAADFVDHLVRYLRMDKLWVGKDFALGYKREGTVAYLTQQGAEKGFSVDVVDMVTNNSAGVTISSTTIRTLVQEGRMEQTRALLGRGYAVRGSVVHGKKRGRAIGFPTANLDVWEEQLIPANGIYAGWAYLNGERFMAMTNVGVSPTFEYKGVTVESYLLDFDRDIYGETLTVTFEKFLRPEMRYDGLEALIAQINRDVDNGRNYLTRLDAGEIVGP